MSDVHHGPHVLVQEGRPKTVFWAASLTSWVYRDRKIGSQKTFRLRAKQMDGSLQSYLDELLHQRALALELAKQIPVTGSSTLPILGDVQDA